MSLQDQIKECKGTAEYQEFSRRLRQKNHADKAKAKPAAKKNEHRRRKRQPLKGCLSSFTGIKVAPPANKLFSA